MAMGPHRPGTHGLAMSRAVLSRNVRTWDCFLPDTRQTDFSGATPPRSAQTAEAQKDQGSASSEQTMRRRSYYRSSLPPRRSSLPPRRRTSKPKPRRPHYAGGYQRRDRTHRCTRLRQPTHRVLAMWANPRPAFTPHEDRPGESMDGRSRHRRRSWRAAPPRSADLQFIGRRSYGNRKRAPRSQQW